MANTNTELQGQDRVNFIAEYAWRNGLNPLAVQEAVEEFKGEENTATEYVLEHARPPELEDEENMKF